MGHFPGAPSTQLASSAWHVHLTVWCLMPHSLLHSRGGSHVRWCTGRLLPVAIQVADQQPLCRPPIQRVKAPWRQAAARGTHPAHIWLS